MFQLLKSGNVDFLHNHLILLLRREKSQLQLVTQSSIVFSIISFLVRVYLITEFNKFTFYSRLYSPLLFIINLKHEFFWSFIFTRRFLGNFLLRKAHRAFWFVPFFSLTSSFVCSVCLCNLICRATADVRQKQNSASLNLSSKSFHMSKWTCIQPHGGQEASHGTCNYCEKERWNFKKMKRNHFINQSCTVSGFRIQRRWASRKSSPNFFILNREE